MLNDIKVLRIVHGHRCEVCTHVARIRLREVHAIKAFRPNSVGLLSPLSNRNANLSTYDIKSLRPNPRTLEAQAEV